VTDNQYPALSATPHVMSLTTPFREEAQVKPGSPPNPYLPSKEEARLNLALPCQILTNITSVKYIK